jgi:hypothetical protein
MKYKKGSFVFNKKARIEMQAVHYKAPVIIYQTEGPCAILMAVFHLCHARAKDITQSSCSPSGAR